MVGAAEEALVKIEAVLPEKERSRVGDTKIFAPRTGLAGETSDLIDLCEIAVEARNILSFDYGDKNEASTRRSVHPLGLWFWGKVWTLVAWCELRDDFRMFRLDRIRKLQITDRRYKPASARSLEEFVKQEKAKYGKH
jgi:predicted DNA-binding transcriptional regulator YafY